MQIYANATDVPVTLPFVNSLGEQVVPTALRYRVVDEAYEEVLAYTAIPTFDAASGAVELTLPVSLNTLGAEQLAGYRRVDLEITVGAAVYVQSAEYVLKKGDTLVVCKNSFQTYEQAVLRSFDMGDLKGWDRASKEQRVAALARAFDALSAFRYRLTMSNDEVLVGDPRELTAAEFNTLVPLERDDFCKAQIAQADYLLGGAPIERDIAEGLQSSTIGEVSQFYRPRPSLSTALCRMALYYVGRYIHWNVEIGRA